MGRLHFPTYGGRISCPPMGVGFISSAKVVLFFDMTKYFYKKLLFFVYFIKK